MQSHLLTAPDLEAVLVPEQGMRVASLRHRGEELLGRRDGLEAYAKTGKTMGIPFLHPWANRLSAWEYEALGKRVSLHGQNVRADSGTGLPMHGTLPRPWTVLDDGVVYHTYSAYARGLDGLWGMYQWLDRAPRGRNESGVWWRRHDEYDQR